MSKEFFLFGGMAFGFRFRFLECLRGLSDCFWRWRLCLPWGVCLAWGGVALAFGVSGVAWGVGCGGGVSGVGVALPALAWGQCAEGFGGVGFCRAEHRAAGRTREEGRAGREGAQGQGFQG